MNFGQRIKLLRLEHDWTQEYVCQKLNISSGALSRYETGMYEPKSLDLVKDFADLFNVSTDYLLGKTDTRNYEEDKANDVDLTGLDNEDIEKIQEYADLIKYKKNVKQKSS